MILNELSSIFEDRRKGDRRGVYTGRTLIERRKDERRSAEFTTQPWWLQAGSLETASRKRA